MSGSVETIGNLRVFTNALYTTTRRMDMAPCASAVFFGINGHVSGKDVHNKIVEMRKTESVKKMTHVAITEAACDDEPVF
jgi:hypothetical protein